MVSSGFSNPDAFMLLVGIQTYGFKFGYSYDMTVPKLSNATGGAHELSTTFEFPCNPRHRKT